MISFKTLYIFLCRTFQGLHCYISHLELLPVYEDGFLYSISQYCQISAQGCFSFHMNQSIHVPVFLPNLHSQPSGKLNFTHLDPVRTLGFFGLVKVSFTSRTQNYLEECLDCPWPFLTVWEQALPFLSYVGGLPRTCYELGRLALSTFFRASALSIVSGLCLFPK